MHGRGVDGGTQQERDEIVTEKEAAEIAALINRRNKLTVAYTLDRLVKKERRPKSEYLWRKSDQVEIVACVKIKLVQWYQAEVLHLSVDEAHTGRGHGKALLCEVERLARTWNARILQCTIREDNAESLGLFVGFGFRLVNTFHNQRSDNNLGVFQKVLEPGRWASGRI
jgi:ribosomal protein S18 acetylase RimI-like enzyme